MTNYTHRIGKAGEYRVASELLLRGFNPAVRSVDDGVDLILDNGITIQVKSTQNLNRKNSYCVDLASSRWKKGKRTKEKQNLKADYLLVWIIPTNDFYIIPAKRIGNKFRVTLTQKKGNIYYPYLNNWEILDKK